MPPKISVIIAAYNEEKLLPRCLESFQKQSYPAEQFEVIVVDNGSKDSTASVAREFGVNVYTYTDIQGCGASRRYGASKAAGSIIAITDADSEVPTDWLMRIDHTLSDGKIVFVAGCAIPDTKSIMHSLVYSYFDVLHASHFMIGKPLVGGYNMALTRAAYDAVDGIDSSLLSCDDWDLAIKVGQKYGKKRVKYDMDLKVKVSTRKLGNINTFFKFSKDGIRNYRNIVLLNRKNAKPTFEVR